MRVFVIGGNGFIGSAVVRDLAQSGHDVVCMLREFSRTERLAGLAYTRVSGDVRNLDSLRRGMYGCDATVHLAAPGGWEADDPLTLHAVIEQGTRNVLRAAGEQTRERAHRVVFVSSTAAINGSDTPELFDERSQFTLREPALVYAHAKHRAERIALEESHDRVSVVIVNPAEVYGPNDTTLATAGNLIDLATSRPVLVCRGGTSIVHVDDVSRGIVAALERGRAGERYILGGDNLSVRELAELVLELVQRRARVITVPNGVVRAAARVAARLHLPLPFNPHVVPYATRFWFVNNAKARRELGVEFRGARDTIGATIEWLRANGHLRAASAQTSTR